MDCFHGNHKYVKRDSSQVCTMVWTSVSYDGKASLRIIDIDVEVDCLYCVQRF